MPYRTQHRGFEARAPYNTVEPVKEEEELKGSQFLDKLGQDIQEGIASATADQEGIGDDIGRLALGGLKNIGHVANLPGIKQGLQIAGAPAWALGQTLGVGLEHGLGIDPRFGQFAGELGGDLLLGTGAAKLGKLGALKSASKLMKTDLPGNRLAGKALQRHYMGKAYDARKGGLRELKQKLGGQSQAMREGNLNFNMNAPYLQGDVPEGIFDVKDLVIDGVAHQSRKAQQAALGPTGIARTHPLIKYPQLWKESRATRLKALDTPVAQKLDKKWKVYDVEDLADDTGLLEELGLKTWAAHIDFENIAQKKALGKKVGSEFKRKRQDNYTRPPSIFNPSLPSYGVERVRDAIVGAYKDLTDTHWHHIFGSEEAAEVMLNKVVQDPVMSVNVWALLRDLKAEPGRGYRNMIALKGKKHVGSKGWHEQIEKPYGFQAKSSAGTGDLELASYIDIMDDPNQIMELIEFYASKVLVRKLRKLKTPEYGGIHLQDRFERSKDIVEQFQ